MNDELDHTIPPEQERHELILVPRDGAYPPAAADQPSHSKVSRTDEWHCPTCGRRVVITYPPRYKKIVLVEGDASVVHSGGKGGIQISSNQISDVDPRLDVWQQWMDAVDFDSQWHE